MVRNYHLLFQHFLKDLLGFCWIFEDMGPTKKSRRDRAGARDTPNRGRRRQSAGVRKSKGGGTKDFLVTLMDRKDSKIPPIRSGVSQMPSAGPLP